jgi:MFS family permease
MTLQQIHEQIENRGMRPWQWLVVALGVLVNMLDGFDLLAASLVAPILSREWALSQEAVGTLLASSALGSAAGAFALSFVADLWGRRTAILINLCLMSVGMLVSSKAQSIEVLTAMRFLTGMGVGAMASCVGTLIFEYGAVKSRNLALGLVTIGYTVGVVVGGIFARMFLAAGFTWNALFVLGGVLTVLLIPLIYFVMPESLDFLISKPKVGTLARVNRVLRHLGIPALDALPAPTRKVAQSSVFDLLKMPILPRQLLMGASYFLYMMSSYFFLNWNNKLTTDAGFTDASGLNISILTNLGGIAGGIIIGALSSRLPFRPVATITLLVMGLAIAAFGGAAHSLAFTMASSVTIGFCIFGAAVVLYATAAATFPPRVRATGIGLSMGAGRLGSFFGPFVAGQMLGITFDLGRPMTCLLLAIPVVVSAAVLAKVPLKPLPGE